MRWDYGGRFNSMISYNTIYFFLQCFSIKDLSITHLKCNEKQACLVRSDGNKLGDKLQRLTVAELRHVMKFHKYTYMTY
jgi:hypothetical protein